MMTLFFLLLFGHAMADFPMQNDFMARAKSPVVGVPGVPWPLVMAVHGIIHGGFVATVVFLFCATSTISQGQGVDGLGFSLQLGVVFGVMEVGLHMTIDIAKCMGLFGAGRRSILIDQGLHASCKAVIAGAVILSLAS